MFFSGLHGSSNRFDAVLIGAGIMSSTLAVILHELEPEMNILIVERLASAALESSSAWNNAGTGHAANCELNYTPILSDGSVDITKALKINNSFEKSLEFWASLTEMGRLKPGDFLKVLPHISFVWKGSDIDFLKKRFQQLIPLKEFAGMEFSEDKSEIRDWIPLVMEDRNPSQKVAATRLKRGTDIDFGALTRIYLELLESSPSVETRFLTEVKSLDRDGNGEWELSLQGKPDSYSVKAPFVFIGAGGGSLQLLQQSGIPQGRFYGGFPVSGQWLICKEKGLLDRHNAKVYGNASVGAPPMSVPHLDTRWIEGEKALLFGPFAGFNTKFLKNGSRWDLFRSIQLRNITSMLQVGVQNYDLVKYLIEQLHQDDQDRIESLKKFFPKAKLNDWDLSIAGQRVQIIKRTSNGGTLKMGTEVVSASDGSLAALLGASPGASIAITIMLEVLSSCWSHKMSTDAWKAKLTKLFPSYGDDFNKNKDLYRKSTNRTNQLLGFI